MAIKQTTGVVLALVLCTSFPAFGQSQSASNTVTPMPLVAPLVIENRDFTTTIYMVNESTSATWAQVKLFDVSGSRLASKRVDFSGHSQRSLRTQDLLASTGRSSVVGSIEVEPEAASAAVMAIAAQASVSSTDGGHMADLQQELMMIGHSGTGVLASTTVGAIESATIAVRNNTAQSQRAALTCLGENRSPFHRILNLNAH